MKTILNKTWKLNSRVAAGAIFGLMLAGYSALSNGATANLPGLQTGPAPWAAEIANLAARLKTINLPALAAEAFAVHIHQHLDLLMDGKPVTVPSGIGINEFARFISPLHTHDTSGVIHIESDRVRDFTLGQFFDVWGVRLTKDCIGGYCAKGNNKLRLFANGKLVSGDPRSLVLTEHQEIFVVYGPLAPEVAVPSTYQFSE